MRERGREDGSGVNPMIMSDVLYKTYIEGRWRMTKNCAGYELNDAPPPFVFSACHLALGSSGDGAPYLCTYEWVVYYESIKRELKTKPIYECRCTCLGILPLLVNDIGSSRNLFCI